MDLKIVIMSKLYFVLLKFENKRDVTISDFNYNLKHHNQCNYPLDFIQLATISNLFPFKLVKKCQHCQPCVLGPIHAKAGTKAKKSKKQFKKIKE